MRVYSICVFYCGRGSTIPVSAWEYCLCIAWIKQELLILLLLYFPGRAEYDCFQIELSKNYGIAEWREDVKNCLLKAGVENTAIVFLFNDLTLIHNNIHCILCGQIKAVPLHATFTILTYGYVSSTASQYHKDCMYGVCLRCLAQSDVTRQRV